MDLKAAHKSSFRNRRHVEVSEVCGCFYCLTMFEPVSIVEWTDSGETPLCPKCGIDSVLASASGVPIDEEFLRAMHARFF